MPHRTTYFFPRQFPERGLDESSKQLLDHEKKKLVNSIKSDTFENDPPKKPLSTSSITTNENDVVHHSDHKHSAVSDLLADGDKPRAKSKLLAGFSDWLVDRKSDHSGHHHLKRYSYSRRLSSSSEDGEHLLPPPETAGKDSAIDQTFDRQVSLPRLSSGSSYAGSLFSGTTLDFNFSSDIKEETSSSSRVSTTTITTATARKKEEEEDKEKLAEKSKESYVLQLTLAKRLTCLASLVTEPVLALGTETWDAESVSYRLWVHYKIQNSSSIVCFHLDFIGKIEFVSN